MTGKKRSFVRAIVMLLVASVVCGVILSCNRISDAELKRQLVEMLPEDMKAITEGVPADALIEKPYYKITKFTNKKVSKCQAKAEVEFYFLKNVKVVILRKFCYHTSQKKWVRFFNEYKNIADSTAGTK